MVTHVHKKSPPPIFILLTTSSHTLTPSSARWFSLLTKRISTYRMKAETWQVLLDQFAFLGHSPNTVWPLGGWKTRSPLACPGGLRPCSLQRAAPKGWPQARQAEEAPSQPTEFQQGNGGLSKLLNSGIVYCKLWIRDWHLQVGCYRKKKKSLENSMLFGDWEMAEARKLTRRLEKEMTTHSSILAWRILGTEEPGGLPSMGLHSQTWLKWLSSSSSCRWKLEKRQTKN